MDADQARKFLENNPRSILATRRRDGGVQMSPVITAVDDSGRAIISSRETAYKVRNLRRDPRAWVCGFTDGFFGPWTQIEGTAEIVSLPEAMDLLVDYYRRLSGEHPDWDDYRNAMQRERRVVIRIPIDAAGPTRSG